MTVVRYGNFLARDFRNGRALLAGDAAHSIAPLSGQGMNTGVQDAFDLAWKLAYVHKGWAPDDLLDSYGADRRPVAEHLVETTNRFFKTVLNPSATQMQVFKTVGPTALKVRKVRESIANFYTELSVAYPHSPLNDRHERRSPKPGEHVIDGNLVRWRDLKPMRLYDVLRGLHWTAIVFSGAEPTPQDLSLARQRIQDVLERWGTHRLNAALIVRAPKLPNEPDPAGLTSLADAGGDLHGRYGAANGGILLVRPDGYIALHRAGADEDFAALDSLLEHLLGPRVGR